MNVFKVPFTSGVYYKNVLLLAHIKTLTYELSNNSKKKKDADTCHDFHHMLCPVFFPRLTHLLHKVTHYFYIFSVMLNEMELYQNG